MTEADAPFRLCFVCWGNICRSPAAEAIMRSLVDEAGLGERITVDSAGTSSEHLGEPPDRRTIKEARRRGLDVEGHRVWRFDRDDFDRFDLVLVVDRVNERRLLDRAPRRRTRRQGQAPAFVRPRRPDDARSPTRGTAATKDFVLAFDLVEEACAALLEHLRCQLPS